MPTKRLGQDKPSRFLSVGISSRLTVLEANVSRANHGFFIIIWRVVALEAMLH